MSVLINDTHTLGGGGKSKDGSKTEKVNNTNIIDKVKENTVPRRIFWNLSKGKKRHLTIVFNVIILTAHRKFNRDLLVS